MPGTVPSILRVLTNIISQQPDEVGIIILIFFTQENKAPGS